MQQLDAAKQFLANTSKEPLAPAFHMYFSTLIEFLSRKKQCLPLEKGNDR